MGTDFEQLDNVYPVIYPVIKKLDTGNSGVQVSDFLKAGSRYLKLSIICIINEPDTR